MKYANLSIECKCYNCLHGNGKPCLQPLFITGLEHNVVARESRVHGIGLFARKRIHIGDIICLYSGTLVSAVKKSDFLAKVIVSKREMFIDGGDVDNFSGRWINHMCNPNARLIQPWEGNGILRYKEKYAIIVVCIKNIQKGEEIFINYGIEYFMKDGVLDYVSYSYGCKKLSQKGM